MTNVASTIVSYAYREQELLTGHVPHYDETGRRLCRPPITSTLPIHWPCCRYDIQSVVPITWTASDFYSRPVTVYSYISWHCLSVALVTCPLPNPSDQPETPRQLYMTWPMWCPLHDPCRAHHVPYVVPMTQPMSWVPCSSPNSSCRARYTLILSRHGRVS